MTGRRSTPEEDIGRHAQRLQRARDNPGTSPLRGLGAFGIIGWSVAVPTVAGAFLGMWLDHTLRQAFPWTIALILGGVTLGGFIAWAWVSKERQNDSDDGGSDDDHS
ncbi:AtpZ/AtpI family protein [Marinobacter caseinilyticus]|uniref:AtpZ/AtpI family protein n=1 Tax=Marinobacter caseinilyticus TaxID=2692195 RepID=UPI001409F6E0|nr:AtpZ/AtpI family protein [Marinobacter caseinilyticus]